MVATSFGGARCLAHIRPTSGLAGDPFQPLHDIGLAVAEVVVQYGAMPGFGEYHGRVTADVAGAAGEQMFMKRTSLRRWLRLLPAAVIQSLP